MRFLSPIGAYRIVAIHDKVQFDSDGRTRTTEPGYVVEFRQGLMNPYERELARTKLQFPGGIVDRQNKDGSPYEYISLASVFDTEWIEDEEMRERVEKRMLSIDGFGRPDNFILVEKPKVEAPWASYDELTIHGRRNAAQVAEKNLEIASVTGVQISHLIAYETENRNDSRVIAAYEAALAGQIDSATPMEEFVQA